MPNCLATFTRKFNTKTFQKDHPKRIIYSINLSCARFEHFDWLFKISTNQRALNICSTECKLTLLSFFKGYNIVVI